jgi:hypothetical protein
MGAWAHPPAADDVLGGRKRRVHVAGRNVNPPQDIGMIVRGAARGNTNGVVRVLISPNCFLVNVWRLGLKCSQDVDNGRHFVEENFDKLGGIGGICSGLTDNYCNRLADVVDAIDR